MTGEENVAFNEALFRETNERVEERVSVFLADGEQFPVLCECASLDCHERITLTKSEYELARSDSTQFVVSLGHSVEEVEDVVFSNDRFQIVRKRGVAAEAAEFLDSDDNSPS
jgi:hypothetical protein